MESWMAGPKSSDAAYIDEWDSDIQRQLPAHSKLTFSPLKAEPTSGNPQDLVPGLDERGRAVLFLCRVVQQKCTCIYIYILSYRFMDLYSNDHNLIQQGETKACCAVARCTQFKEDAPCQQPVILPWSIKPASHEIGGGHYYSICIYIIYIYIYIIYIYIPSKIQSKRMTASNRCKNSLSL